MAEARITLHVEVQTGRNAHHVVEAQFKAVARALRDAVSARPAGHRRAVDEGDARRVSRVPASVLFFALAGFCFGGAYALLHPDANRCGRRAARGCSGCSVPLAGWLYL